jgi:hypothetical protein
LFLELFGCYERISRTLLRCDHLPALLDRLPLCRSVPQHQPRLTADQIRNISQPSSRSLQRCRFLRWITDRLCNAIP